MTIKISELGAVRFVGKIDECIANLRTLGRYAEYGLQDVFANAPCYKQGISKKAYEVSK